MAGEFRCINNLFPSNPNFNFGLFASSNSGKSIQAVTFIKNFSKFYPQHKVSKVIVVSSIYQPLYDGIKENHALEFHQKIDELLLEKIDAAFNPNEYIILFIDDMGTHLANNNVFTKLVTIYGHHRNVCNIVTAHSIHLHSTTHWRTFIKNLHVIGIGSSATQRHSASILFTQIFGPGGAKHCKLALKEAEKLQKLRYGNNYWFLFVNTSSCCDSDNRIFYDAFSSIPLIFVLGD